MKIHERPAHSWIKLGTDIFSINRQDYLIISDYYSRYPVVRALPRVTRNVVINTAKEVIPMFVVKC